MTRARLGYAVFAFLCLLTALVSTRAYFLPLDVVMENMVGYVTTMPWGLWGHLIFAPLAIALAPVQLSTTLRARWPRLHRISGYLYGGAILLGGLASLGLSFAFTGTDWARLGFILLALFWMGSTGYGISRAIAGDYRAHRRWMLRSVAFTFAAVTLRLIMPVLLASGWTVLETYDLTAWASWLINILAVEWWLRRRRAAAPQFA